MEDKPNGQSTGPAPWKDLVEEANGNLTDLIAMLSEQRETLRDLAIEEIQRHAQYFVERIDQLDREELQEELACFRDLLALHRRLRSKNERRP